MNRLTTFLAGMVIAVIALVAGQHLEWFQGEPLFQVRSGANRASDSDTELIVTGPPPPAVRAGSTMRIASFNIQAFNHSKAAKAHVMDLLARIVREFDIVAVQEIRSRSDDLVPNFVELVNAAGRHYDYVIGPRQGRGAVQDQYAFVFDAATVEVDRTQLYTVADPDDLLLREPLVAWFRARGPPADEAFTFTLVNVHVDPERTAEELDVLADVFRLVRDDGRGEDDVILLGTFYADDRHLGALGRLPGLTAVISATPTNTQSTEQRDNVLFDRRATNEFTGRGGIFDFLRQYNLSLQEALEVSDHLPVWAEFHVYEGGQPGRVATRPSR